MYTGLRMALAICSASLGLARGLFSITLDRLLILCCCKQANRAPRVEVVIRRRCLLVLTINRAYRLWGYEQCRHLWPLSRGLHLPDMQGLVDLLGATTNY